MTNVLVFFIYFIIIGLVILKYSNFKNNTVSNIDCLIIYSIKVTVGILYAHYFNAQDQIVNADTWTYFIESKEETDYLIKQPFGFLKDLFEVKYENSGGLFASTYSYWNDLKANFFIKILAFLNLLSNKNYYVSLLFLNLFFLYGGLALFKLANIFFSINKYLLISAIFLAPSTLFWCSSVHKDGILFTSLIVSIYCFSNLLNHNVKTKYYFYLVVSVLILFALRNHYLLAILPAFLAYFLTVKFKVKYSFIIITSSCLFLLFISPQLNKILFLANSIVEKHNDFNILEGNSKFPTPSLKLSSLSLIFYLPFALKVIFLHPLINIFSGVKYFFIGLENMVYLALFILATLKIIKKNNHPLVSLFFNISFFLSIFIGYIVCFDAAVMRYRSCFLPLFLLACFLTLFGKPKVVLNT